MSTLSEKIKDEVEEVFHADWDIRDGQVVPSTDDIELRDQAVRLDATYLYADLKDSTGLAKKFTPELAARVIRMFLRGAGDVIKARGGEIRSFDGDRVMAIFIGESKNSNAALTALNINWVVEQVIKPKLKKERPALQQHGWEMAHCVGVATGKAFLVRGGVWGFNDIVSVGEAPNVAAKLSAVRGEYSPSLITREVYSQLNVRSKLGGALHEDMWTGPKVRQLGPYTLSTYRSGWMSRP